MHVKQIEMIWIVVKNWKESIKFYTETVGLKLMESHEEFGWAELQGHEGGARLGIAKMCDLEDVKPGENGVVTFTVEDIEKARIELSKKKVKLLGPVQEILGHVKMQKGIDADGNIFQLVQKLF